jgi:Ca-activated chloride channel family protein
MSRVVLLMVFTLVSTASIGARQDPPAQSSQPPVFRSSASMVAVNVTVLDGRKLVSGLEIGDFEVYEDGVQQQVQFFESRSVPLDVILLLDTSSSMGDKMVVVHEAARGFMKGLRAGDRGAVVTFADSVKIVQDLTSDVAAIEAAINQVEAKGSTSLRNAIYVALKQFGQNAKGTGEVRRQAIAVLSDGEDTASIVSFDDVMTLARKTGVNIYTIGLRSPNIALRSANERRFLSNADYGMKMLANETGGQAFFPETVHQLKDVYQSIGGELSAQYSIGYSPSNQRNDGRFRRILVRIISNPAFKLRARAGYTADSPRASIGVVHQQRGGER